MPRGNMEPLSESDSAPISEKPCDSIVPEMHSQIFHELPAEHGTSEVGLDDTHGCKAPESATPRWTKSSSRGLLTRVRVIEILSEL